MAETGVIMPEPGGTSQRAGALRVLNMQHYDISGSISRLNEMADALIASIDSEIPPGERKPDETRAYEFY
jgi:hypothetical protein